MNSAGTLSTVWILKDSSRAFWVTRVVASSNLSEKELCLLFQVNLTVDENFGSVFLENYSPDFFQLSPHFLQVIMLSPSTLLNAMTASIASLPRRICALKSALLRYKDRVPSNIHINIDVDV